MSAPNEYTPPVPIAPYFGWTAFTPAVPDLYYDVYSAEERIKKLCMEMHKMVEYANRLGIAINTDHDIINELEVSWTKLLGDGYVPQFADPLEWDDSTDYAPLTIVTYHGNSYTSRQYVPAGTSLDDSDYWVETGNYNAQIEDFRQALIGIQATLPSDSFSSTSTVKDYIDNANAEQDAILPIGDFNATNTVKKYIDDANAEQDAILPIGDFNATNTVKKYIDDSNTELNGELRDALIPFPTNPQSKYGSATQVLSTLGNGETEWVNPIVPTDAQAETYISAWLNAHPEATTTVEDNSLNGAAKLIDGSIPDSKLVQAGGVLSALNMMIYCNLERYDGGIAAIRQDASADTSKIYIATTAGSGNNRLMIYENGTWNYFKEYKITDIYLYNAVQALNLSFDGLTYLNTYDAEQNLNIIPKFLTDGVTPYDGGVDTINADDTADTSILYYNNRTTSASRYRLMYHDGTAWQYSTLYYYYYNLTDGIYHTLPATGANHFSILSGNFGSFNKSSTETPETYIQNFKDIFSDSEYDILGAEEWSDSFAGDSTLNSTDLLIADTTSYSYVPDTGSARAFCRGKWEYVSTIRINSVAGSYASCICIVLRKPVDGDYLYAYVGYFMAGQDNQAIRAAQYQMVIDNIITNNRKYAVILGDFNAWNVSEYGLWTANNFRLANGGYYGTYNTLRDIPADNIIVSQNISISNVKVYTGAVLNTDHTLIKADIIV